MSQAPSMVGCFLTAMAEALQELFFLLVGQGADLGDEFGGKIVVFTEEAGEGFVVVFGDLGGGGGVRERGKVDVVVEGSDGHAESFGEGTEFDLGLVGAGIEGGTDEALVAVHGNNPFSSR